MFAVHIDGLGGWCLTSRDVEVLDAPGRVLSGLELDTWEDKLDTSGRSMSSGLNLDLVLPEDVDAFDAIRGHHLAGADVTIARLAEEDGSAQWPGRVLLRAFVDGVEVDDARSVIALRVVPYEYEPDRKVPGPSSLVSVWSADDPTGTWEFLDPSALTHRMKQDIEGTAYPAVFGQPYLDGAPTTPAPVLYETAVGGDATTLLLSVGKCEESFEPSVTLHWRGDNHDPDSHGPINAVHRVDKQGQQVVVLSLAGLSGTVPLQEVEYYISWHTAYTRGSGLGNVLARLLALSGVRYDVASLKASLAVLNRVRLSGYVDDPVDVMSWLQDRVLGTLPVARADVGNGLRLVPIQWDATAQDAVARFELGDGTAVRDGPYRLTGAGRPAIVRVRYGYDAAEDDLTQVVTRATTDATFHAAGVKPQSAEIDLVDVYDESTADFIARYQLWLKGPKLRVDLEITEDRYPDLAAGDVVLVSDPDLSSDDLVCLVESMEWGDEAWIRVGALVL